MGPDFTSLAVMEPIEGQEPSAATLNSDLLARSRVGLSVTPPLALQRIRSALATWLEPNGLSQNGLSQNGYVICVCIIHMYHNMCIITHVS
jgi:hypothetical protein